MSVIIDTKELAAICQKLAKNDFLTIDTEFLRERTYYPKLCLVQLAGPDIDAVAVDVLDKDLDLQPLYDLLMDESVVKVFHAARQDLEIFYNHMGAVPTPIFDTQVAAMVCGLGDSIGYNNLISEICGVRLDKGAQFTDWSRRPLSGKQLSYALDDVTYLRDAYLALSSQLEEKGRKNWVIEEMDILRDPATYENPPEIAYQRIKVRSENPKTLVILKELGAWREKEAQRRDMPRGHILRDDSLVDIAVHAPKNAHELSKSRKISKDMANGHMGAAILKCVERALATPKNEWPKPERKKRMDPEFGAALEMLKMLLRIQANEHGVAAKLIASANELQEIACDDAAGSKVLKGWRHEVFGRDAMALKAGNISLSLENNKIKKIKS
jgi:ribonuclease D